jgi:hypothetical protein
MGLPNRVVVSVMRQCSAVDGWDMAQRLALPSELEAHSIDWLGMPSGGYSPVQQVRGDASADLCAGRG